MIWVLIITVLCALFFFMKYFLMRRQLHDITDQMETHLKDKRIAKLTVTLSDRTVESLAWQINQLIDQQQTMNVYYKQSERAQKEAIASMSHDLRTPLTAMIGYLQLLEQRDVSERDRKQYLTIVLNRAKHLEKLINNFFALSVIESSDNQLSFERFSLKQVLEETLLTYYDSFQMENLELDLELSKNPAIIIANLHCTRRVIENILLNVLQHHSTYTSKKATPFYVQLIVDEQWAKLRVVNNHSQVELDEQKLFNRFYTADPSRQAEGGLGLSIVKSLMEQMSGQVDVELTTDQFLITCCWKIAT